MQFGQRKKRLDKIDRIFIEKKPSDMNINMILLQSRSKPLNDEINFFEIDFMLNCDLERRSQFNIEKRNKAKKSLGNRTTMRETRSK